MNDRHDGVLVVISGPSGSGKGSVISEYIKTAPPTFLSVSATTRTPREGEVNGQNYYFLTHDQFQKEIEEDNMLEWARYCDNFYGTPKKPVYDHLKNAGDVFLELDVVGALNVKKNYDDAILIFVLPPSMEVLKERLKGRGTETAEVIQKRLLTAEKEMEKMSSYDYLLINDDLHTAADNLKSIIWAEKSKMKRLLEMFKRGV